MAVGEPWSCFWKPSLHAFRKRNVAAVALWMAAGPGAPMRGQDWCGRNCAGEGTLGFGGGWAAAGAVGAQEGRWVGRWCQQGQHPSGGAVPGARLCPDRALGAGT